MRRLLVVTLFAGLTIGAQPAMAQSDLTAFGTTCLAAQGFFLGQVPEGVDVVPIMTPLCACLTTTFAPLPQADIDMLVSDIEGTSTDATHAAYGDYTKLLESASTGLTTCQQSAEVQAAIEAITVPAPADPAAAPDAKTVTP